MSSPKDTQTPYELLPEITTLVPENPASARGDNPDILSPDLKYSEKNVIGVGGFGAVYKGRYMGYPVAIKVMEKDSYTFRNEAQIMTMLAMNPFANTIRYTFSNH